MAPLIALIAATAMVLLWIGIYAASRSGGRFARLAMVQIGTVVVWPVLSGAVSLAALNAIFEDMPEPFFNPLLLGIPVAAFVGLLLLWLTGNAAATGLGYTARRLDGSKQHPYGQTEPKI